MINTEYIQAILDGDKVRLEELREPPKTSTYKDKDNGV